MIQPYIVSLTTKGILSARSVRPYHRSVLQLNRASLFSTVTRDDGDDTDTCLPPTDMINRRWTNAGASFWDDDKALSSPSRLIELQSNLADILRKEKERTSKWTMTSGGGMLSLNEDQSDKNDEDVIAGVLRPDRSEDIRLLVDNYTSPMLASAVRDREDTLQLCAHLMAAGDVTGLRDILQPYGRPFVDKRRLRDSSLDLRDGFNTSTLEVIRKRLTQMPRQVTRAHRRRAAIVLPLCNVCDAESGRIYPSILFEKRSMNMRRHPGEVCLPGGKVSTGNDRTIVSTSLREMEEEIGISMEEVNVLGILRCNWGEVAKLTGTAVTPVIGYVGNLTDSDMNINPSEVSECFTVPLTKILDSDNWIYKPKLPPIFNGCPYPIWGLTGYILDRFVKDVLGPYQVTLSKGNDSTRIKI
mmetsp:Transcript_1830/g.3911  ORF Transcript_1830/g.3911 Transcript_1830/m.3911 type:complete len:414 (-) Transcript_1830:105-1346(-)